MVARSVDHFIERRLYAAETQMIRDLWRYLRPWGEHLRDYPRDAYYRYGGVWSWPNVGTQQRYQSITRPWRTETEGLLLALVGLLYLWRERFYRAAFFGQPWALGATLIRLDMERLRADLEKPLAGVTTYDGLVNASEDILRRLERELKKSLVAQDNLPDLVARLNSQLGWEGSTILSPSREAGAFARFALLAGTTAFTAYNLGVSAYVEMAAIPAVMWVTARDEKVCRVCRPLDGRVWEREEAHPSPALHPHCRCRLYGVTVNRSSVPYVEWRNSQNLVGEDGGILEPDNW